MRRYAIEREAEREASIVDVVGGHPIRQRSTLQRGSCFVVGETGQGFFTLEEAQAYAERNKIQ